MPDKDRPGHFLPLSKTSTVNADGSQREPDDMQPRANLKKLFKKGEISSDSLQAIETFSKSYSVETNLVCEYIRHLEHLKYMQDIRTRERESTKKKRSEKQYTEYEWDRLIMNGKLGGLLVSELDKYLDHNKMNKSGKKSDKIKRIMCFHMRNEPQKTKKKDVQVTEEESMSESEESDSDNDIIFNAVTGEESERDTVPDERKVPG